GGVFGVLLAFALLFPRARLIVLPIPIPLPAWLFVTLYAVLELFFGVTGRAQGVAHFAHLGGVLGGALCLLALRKPRYRPRPRARPSRPARRPAGVAEQRIADAPAAEPPPVGQRPPVPPAGDARVDAAHVQGALRIAAEGGAALEFEVHREVVVRATRRL